MKCLGCNAELENNENTVVDDEGRRVCIRCGTIVDFVESDVIFEDHNQDLYSIHQEPKKHILSRTIKPGALYILEHELKQASTLLGIGSYYDSTLELFARFNSTVEGKHKYGQKGKMNILACLYIVSEKFSLNEFAKKLAIDKYELGKAVKNIKSNLKISPFSKSLSDEITLNECLRWIDSLENVTCYFDIETTSKHNRFREIEENIELESKKSFELEDKKSFELESKKLITFKTNHQSSSITNLEGSLKKIQKLFKIIKIQFESHSFIKNRLFPYAVVALAFPDSFTKDKLSREFSIDYEKVLALKKKVARSLLLLIKHLPWFNEISSKNIHFFLNDILLHWKPPEILHPDKSNEELKEIRETESDIDEYIEKEVLLSPEEVRLKRFITGTLYDK